MIDPRLVIPGGTATLIFAMVQCQAGAPAEGRTAVAPSPGPAPASVVPVASVDASAPKPKAPRRQPQSTPDKILCGSSTCDLKTEVCCASEDGAGIRCAPRPTDSSVNPCDKDQLAKFCDGAEDCPGGACCRTANCTNGCPVKLACEAPGCATDPGGVCIAGGACPDGFSCRGEDEVATCTQSDPGVQCGAKRCQGAIPACCWNKTTKKAVCADTCTGDLVGEVTELHCANSADCAGNACGHFAGNPRQSYGCMGISFAADRFSPILCATVSDCPKFQGQSPTGCSPPKEADALPPGVKACDYPYE